MSVPSSTRSLQVPADDDAWDLGDDGSSLEWEALEAESLDASDEWNRVSSGRNRLAASVQRGRSPQSRRQSDGLEDWGDSDELMEMSRPRARGRVRSSVRRSESRHPLFDQFSLEQAFLFTQVLGPPRAVEPHRPNTLRDPNRPS